MIILLTAAAVAWLCVAGVYPWLRHRVLDVPNGRSSHDAPTPRGGGIGVLLAVVLVVSGASVADRDDVAWVLLLVGLFMAAVGLVDDLRSLSAGVRLVAQLLGALLLAGWLVTGLDVSWPWLASAALAVVVAGYVNIFNFMDGINGISALNAAVAGLWFAFLGDAYAVAGLTTLALAVAGAAVAFVPWNLPHAKLFLGDVGSYGLGALIVGMACLAWVGGAPVTVAAAPLVIYGADTTLAIAKRAHGRRPITEAHREHVYQRVVDAGWSHGATAALTAAAAAVASLGTWLTRGNVYVGTFLLVLVAGTYLLLPYVARARGPVSA